MPTKAEIEAAARALCREKAARGTGPFVFTPEKIIAFVEMSWCTHIGDATAALTAAEEVREKAERARYKGDAYDWRDGYG